MRNGYFISNKQLAFIKPISNRNPHLYLHMLLKKICQNDVYHGTEPCRRKQKLSTFIATNLCLSLHNKCVDVLYRNGIIIQTKIIKISEKYGKIMENKVIKCCSTSQKVL